MDGRRSLGTAGERIAEAELARSGLLTVARNARTRWGEIDLVCRERTGYVFVEVKTRRAGSFVDAREAVDARKSRRLARLAEAWLAGHGERGVAWRVMVAAVTVGVRGAAAVVLLDVT